MQYIERYAELPFPLSDVGTWWGGSRRLKKEIEIDIVATSAIGDDALIGSVKYREKKTRKVELDLMRSYAAEMGGFGRYRYWFFSKSGFEDDLKQLEDDDVRLFSIDDIYDIR